MAHLALSLFGPLQITLDGRALDALESDKVRALLIYLAVEAGRPQRREALAGLLWPELPERAARHNLSQALFNLRRALGDQAADPPFLLISRDAIQLNEAAGCWLEAQAFLGLLAACDAHPHQQRHTCSDCAGRLAEAAALYRGDFLAQFSLAGSAAFEEWAVAWRERLRREMLGALGALARHHEWRGAYELARRFTERLIELDPLREAAHRGLMRLLTLDGQRALALAQYERCRAILAAELGVEPEAETRALYEQLRDADAGAVIAERQLAPPAPRPHNLPLPLTPFVGREQELTTLAAMIGVPDCRLITIVGPGGIGKTRLALQAAAELLEQFADGVRFVPLAELRAPELIAPAICAALELELHGPEEPAEQLVAHLAEQALLLVIDNCEQLVAGAPLLAALLERAPGVRILATSRERLGLPGEWLLEVDGLEAPEGDGASEAYSAVALFVQSARRLRAGYTLTAEDGPAVGEICRLVEGMPLGIELAAGWARTLSCAEIADEIRRGMAFLTTAMRHIPERHRSLMAVVAHSWELLLPEEQVAARRLAVFHGGCRREQAEPVAGATLPLLAALVDKSLLRRSVGGRYTMHEAVAQFARGQLVAAGEEEATRTRHLGAFIELAEIAEQQLLGGDQLLWLNRLEAEHDNLRGALRWAIDRGDGCGAARLGAALWRFWWMRSHPGEGVGWLEQALALGGAPPALRARLLHGAGVLTHEQGNYARARAWYEESLTLRQTLGDRRGVAASLNSLGVAAMDQRDYRRAQQLYEESLAIKRELGDERGIAGSLNNLGMVMSAQGDYEQAQRLYEESLAAHRRLGERFAVATVLGNLGAVALERGDPARARAHFAESLARFHELGDKDGIAECLEGLAVVAARLGEDEGAGARRAARLCGAAEALRRAIGSPLIPMERARFEALLALARERLGDEDLAALRASGAAMALDEAVAYAGAE
jgi:predicted ATPase/DNA-binding SARP family transcriptional activator